jgi:hypothetical protein
MYSVHTVDVTKIAVQLLPLFAYAPPQNKGPLRDNSSCSLSHNASQISRGIPGVS